MALAGVLPSTQIIEFSGYSQSLAGAVGFEPPYGGIKNAASSIGVPLRNDRAQPDNADLPQSKSRTVFWSPPLR
jgi:hypothetical protein